jgi:signal transduction histidine kinase
MDERALIWAGGRDGTLTSEFLKSARFEAESFRSGHEICRELERGAGVLILAAEVLSHPESRRLRELLVRQSTWSDIPVVVVAGRTGTPGALNHMLHDFNGVSVLHRPLSLDTLISTVGAALRARRRQCQIRDLLQNRDESDRRREEFLAMLAHELRNPLSPIRTGLQVLRITESEDLAARVRSMMERQVGNLSRLIDDLLDVSRITRGKISLAERRSCSRCRRLVNRGTRYQRPVSKDRGQASAFRPVATLELGLQLLFELNRLRNAVLRGLFGYASVSDPVGHPRAHRKPDQLPPQDYRFLMLLQQVA